MLICRNFASSRNLWKAIVPPLHGGGQEFESLGSTLKVVVCRENPSRKGPGEVVDPDPFVAPWLKSLTTYRSFLWWIEKFWLPDGVPVKRSLWELFRNSPKRGSKAFRAVSEVWNARKSESKIRCLRKALA
jgi:hypothetical protein